VLQFTGRASTDWCLDHVALQETLKWCELTLFTRPAPVQLTEEMSSLLEDLNNKNAINMQGAPLGWEDPNRRQAPADPADSDSNAQTAFCQIKPSKKWFVTSTSRRPAFGHRLITSAQAILARISGRLKGNSK
jgi:hypothetical protein